MDTKLDEQLREENVIGQVSNVHRDKIHFKPRTVNFSWQRGFKIGESSYYCVHALFFLIILSSNRSIYIA